MPKHHKTQRSVDVSKIDSILFQCDGALLQYCNRNISIWIDGDASKPADIELDIDVLNRIAKIGEEQAEEFAIEP